MNKLDQMIEDALSEEDRVIADATAERGWFALSLGVYSGKLGWVSWVITIAQTALFVAGVWCAVVFFQAQEALLAVKWGISGAVLLLSAISLKLSLMPQIQADRILRELRRVELMLARREGGK